ncbi:hypothetical protein FZEAL_3213 [Fusarium zealandicum]|uniref:Sensitive to high expression protein 9, mitochondrial n=1 Tax=Fusarium zealandicum TaxID=1053134 RepID=A0A8H4XM05_9HYPO|nr:hypothetical protein FZEAL_3213 [Fusarium zealandicum]
MQPFARPVARLVWSHARLRLGRATRTGRTSWGGSPVQSSTICMRCSISQAIGIQGRLYSTQPPSKDADSSSNSRTNKDVEAELESILKPRPNPITEAQPIPDEPNLEDTKLGDATPESTTPGDVEPSDKKPEHDAEIVRPNDADGPQKSHLTAEDIRAMALSRVNELKERFSQAMDRMQAKAMNASQTLNDITGYTDIETIKLQNAVLETSLADAHERVRNARQAYKTSNSSRAATQREVTTLLARKDSWSPADLERFTELYRTDHVLEGKVVSSQETLTEAEIEEQSLSQRLNAGILKRYHEEQIWSDRIRRASTWGTFGLMGMNFVLFVVLQFVAEPWRRRRLVNGVVAEEKAVLEEVRGQLEQVKFALERRDQPAAAEALAEAVETTQEAEAWPFVEAAVSEEGLPADETLSTEAPGEPIAAPVEPVVETVTERPPLPPLEKKLQEGLDALIWLRSKAEDLYSERHIDLRMRDASLLALEGALAGAAVAGGIALLIVRGS